MKTIDLAKSKLSLDEASKSARDESLLLKCANGEQFVVSIADDFATEVELLRKNHAFLEFLDSCKQDKTNVSLEQFIRQTNGEWTLKEAAGWALGLA